MQSRLYSWKGKLLNKVGRVTLAKSVLSSIPIYSMQAMWLPQNLYDDLDKIVKKFIWGTNDGRRGLHLVKWNTVICPRNRGGLGIQDTRCSNTALLGKLV